MNLSFKNRITFYFVSATALLMLLAFLAVYFVVSETVFNNLDSDLLFEAKKHVKEVNLLDNNLASLCFTYRPLTGWLSKCKLG